MTTALDLIESAALKLGAIGTGESLTASEGDDCLNVLNSMLDNWAAKRLMVYQIVQNSYSWASGNASRTIGSGGNFNGTRPVRIEDGTFFRDSGNNDYPVTILRDRASYDSLPGKSDQSEIPSHLYYDPAYPLGTIYAYPVPSATITLKLNHWQTLQSFAALTTDLSLPPGYRWAIENNLAIYLEPIFSVPVPASVVREAATAKADLMRVNNIPLTAVTEVPYIIGGGRRTDIYSGG